MEWFRRVVKLLLEVHIFPILVITESLPKVLRIPLSVRVVSRFGFNRLSVELTELTWRNWYPDPRGKSFNQHLSAAMLNFGRGAVNVLSNSEVVWINHRVFEYEYWKHHSEESCSGLQCWFPSTWTPAETTSLPVVSTNGTCYVLQVQFWFFEISFFGVMKGSEPMRAFIVFLCLFSKYWHDTMTIPWLLKHCTGSHDYIQRPCFVWGMSRIDLLSIFVNHAEFLGKKDCFDVMLGNLAYIYYIYIHYITLH